MGWKAFYFMKYNEEENTNTKNTFGFKTTKTAPQTKELKGFEDDLIAMTANVKFNNNTNTFQKQLNHDVKKINNSTALLVPADKTNNIYEVDKQTYEKLLNDSITTHYKKDQNNTATKINKEAKHIVEQLEIAERVEITAQKQCYVTIKDHKANFANNTKCRLINPTKSNTGKISKQLLQDINSKVREEQTLLQWRNTSSVIQWFQSLNDKTNLQFIQLDIQDFYASITETLFDQAISWAATTCYIPNTTIKTIKNSCQSILYNQGTAWIKKNGEFDVTMGAYHGAEVCELVGLHIIHQMNTKFPNINFGLYRDDGLGVHQKTDGPSLNRTKKDIIKLFQTFGLKITIETDMKQVDFLDITLNLQTNTFQPYRKPNNRPQYVHAQSNHPPQTIKNIPPSINKRINEISSSRQIFEDNKAEYNDALKESGYKERLEYNNTDNQESQENNRTTTKKNRRRNITWYNPPYNSTVTTNLGKQFLALVNKHFDKKNPLTKIFNRNTVKLSYSCTKNMSSIIQNHNNKIINNQQQPTTKQCNCRDKNKCPLDNKCQAETIIYKATIETTTGTKHYIGSTEKDFKTRYTGHKQSFNTQYKKNATALSQCVWAHGMQPNPTVKWEILQNAQKYKPGNSACDLCLSEKLHILKTYNKEGYLNKKNEIAKRCPHRDKYSLERVQ